jgi:hypothetical protein
MPWGTLSLVTDQDLGALEPLAIAAGSPWGKTAWPEARAEAKRELKILIEAAFGKIVKQPADRVLDTHAADLVYTYISSIYADVTAVGTDNYEDDITLTTVFATIASRLYIGADYQFDGLFVKMKDALNAVASTLTVKYQGAAGWTAMPNANDGTSVNGAPFAQTGRITWPIVPGDWKRQRLATSGDQLFWIELSVGTALNSGSAKAGQLLTVRVPDGLRRVAQLLALSNVLNGLERQSAKPKDWQEKATGYRQEALALFQMLKEQGGIPLDTNRDDVIERAETLQTAPLRLGRA